MKCKGGTGTRVVRRYKRNRHRLTHSSVCCLVLLLTMETLQTLAMAVFMSCFKDLDCWEDVVEKVYDINPLLWPMETEMMKEWEKGMMERKKKTFKNVHRQLVSNIIV